MFTGNGKNETMSDSPKHGINGHFGTLPLVKVLSTQQVFPPEKVRSFQKRPHGFIRSMLPG